MTRQLFRPIRAIASVFAFAVVLVLSAAQGATAQSSLDGQGIGEMLGNALRGSQLVAGERQLPISRGQMQLSFAPLVKQTAPAVVNVFAERTVANRSPFAGDPFFERFFGNGFPGQSERQSSLGSGVVVDASGIVVTNHHVIEGADEIRVAFADGREFASRLLLKDERVDLAILQIDAPGPFGVVQLADSDAVEVGDLVLAIGNPFGVGQTVTSGIVSALARNQVGVSDFGFFIQTDAAINPGNSGGALVDMNGQLIGINTAIFSRSGGSNGIGFAIPANMVRVVIAAATAGDERFERPYLGATFEPVTPDIAEALGMIRARGTIITSIDPKGPAAAAGMDVGDVILKMNGFPIDHPDALGYRIATTGIGGAAQFEVLSRGKILQVNLELMRAPETGPRDEQRIDGRNPFAGATVANLSPRLAIELGMRGSSTGVVVLSVERNSPAARFGLQPRDIVLAVNGSEIDNVRRLLGIAESGARGWRFELDRNGRRLRQFVR